MDDLILTGNINTDIQLISDKYNKPTKIVDGIKIIYLYDKYYTNSILNTIIKNENIEIRYGNNTGKTILFDPNKKIINVTFGRYFDYSTCNIYLIHILAWLLNYYNFVIMNPKFINCIYKSIFNKNFDYYEISVKCLSGFSWIQESCYIDSLLISLFLSDTDQIILDQIFYPEHLNDISEINCKNTTLSIKDAKDISKLLSTSLLKQYSELFKNSQNEKCFTTNIRQILKNCIPEIEKQIYDPINTWNIITDFFPSLKIKYIINTWDKESLISFNESKTAVFTISEFMENKFYNDKNPIHQKINWEQLKVGYLIFENTGFPYLLNSEIDEIENNNLFIKTRILSYKILDKYLLHAVIMYKEKHYYCYLKIFNNIYLYDDLKKDLSLISENNEWPNLIWKNTSVLKPLMFIYLSDKFWKLKK